MLQTWSLSRWDSIGLILRIGRGWTSCFGRCLKMVPVCRSHAAPSRNNPCAKQPAKQRDYGLSVKVIKQVRTLAIGTSVLRVCACLPSYLRLKLFNYRNNASDNWKHFCLTVSWWRHIVTICLPQKYSQLLTYLLVNSVKVAETSQRRRMVFVVVQTDKFSSFQRPFR